MLKNILTSLKSILKISNSNEEIIPSIFTKYMSTEDYDYLIKQTKLHNSNKQYIN